MVVDDGGRRAARGFHYQYLRTLEALLSVVDQPSVASVRVEGSPDGSEQIDFDVVGSDGARQVAAQVKSRRAGSELSAAEGFRLLMDLVQHDEAGEYQVLTNALPGPGAPQLARAIGDAEDPIALSEAVLPLIEHAPKQRQRFFGLPESQKQRLCRSRLLFDPRSDDELRNELRERVRVHRNRVREGLGDHAAGLLLRSLVAEILDRAADSDRASFTTEQFRTALLQSSEELYRVLGVRDCGIITGFPPPVPDIHRHEYVTRLEAAFTDTSGRVPRQAALVGLSGLGKSSLAAAYLAEHADTYDLVMWIDAENDVTVLESLHHILDAVRDTASDTSRGGDLRSACASVHAELSRLPGPWLMVLDNVHDASIRRMCIPSIGRGDVIITSVDSASRYGQAELIEVTAMQPDEAMGLLRRRLGKPDTEWTPDVERSAAEMARDLEYWPLALELAAGYLLTCDIPLSDIEHYRTTILTTSLNDEQALPAGYPRTLAAVVASAVQHLGTDPDRQERRLALSMLNAAAYLAPHRLPIQLLAACSLLDPRDCVADNHQGPLIPDPAQHSPLEAVRELRRFSLVRSDLPIPGIIDDSTPSMRASIQMNEVVQFLLRSWTRTADNDDRLRVIAFHVERWLNVATSTAHFAGSVVMAGHALVLAEYLRKRGLRGEKTALLYGQVAGVLRYQGDLKRADELWRYEVDLLQQDPDGTNQLLLAQTNLSLVGIYQQAPETSSLNHQEAKSRVGQIYTTAQQIAADHPGAATRLAIMAVSMLADPDTQEVRHAEFTELYRLFVDLKVRLDPQVEPTAFSRLMDQLQQANRIVVDRPAEVEHTCREILTRVLDGQPELEVRRLLLEALVHQDKWAEAEAEFAYVKELLGYEAMLHDSLSVFVGNIGLVCAGRILLASQDDAALLLASILEWPVITAVTPDLRPGVQARLRLLNAVREYHAGSQARAREILKTLRPASLQDGHPNEVVGWSELLRMTRSAVQARTP